MFSREAALWLGVSAADHSLLSIADGRQAVYRAERVDDCKEDPRGRSAASVVDLQDDLPSFDAVANKALAKNVENRYQPAHDLSLALWAALE